MIMNAPLAKPLVKVQPAATDPQWYKDAVIYQLHIKSFFDANNDGIGDFPGLVSKLDYIADLGVTAIWLLPFYPSPRLDDGYDISEYRAVHRDYGLMADVKRFIAAAHARGLRVITELVINHTSDQHPWFQRARQAKPGSPYRDFYVWSDSDQKYTGTRIIFIDTERSNWTWDPVAKAYFWHRFYSHQPDLNFDNPRVLKAVLGVMRHWLDLGVDGLRLDAVPYLVEREGTINENLPETHDVLKRIRAELDRDYPGRMLLAEANQWPEDTKDYFGGGDECHMAFHFPLMPRMYMALAREDRFPITDILRQTPAIPDNCQWAIFLRNHDELTLEMVTDSERDYLWQTYAADRRARLNLGIRRRLAPLLERDRRRVELMNCLLLSMPGTPVIYYGDEIGMGDNIHLGDRDGVRTPMQWSPDRNGGFSKADPAGLVLPAIMDPLYGYEAVNVESQSRDPHSLLNWMRRMLAVRRQHCAFGRGTLRFLYPKNRKILAYLREYEGETILCVANISRAPQAVELDLSGFAGRVPIELNGGSVFPPIGQLTYLLTLPPYGFYWFVLASENDWPSWHTPAPEPLPDFETLILRTTLADAVRGGGKTALETSILPSYLAKRRWFSAKDQALKSARIAFSAPLPGATREIVLTEIETETARGLARWQLPLTIAWEDEPAAALPGQLALSRARRGRRVGLMTDGFAVPEFAQAMLASFASGATLPTQDGEIRFEATKGRADDLLVPAESGVNWLSAEQSNSSLIVGDKVMLKIFRRVAHGEHPEAEMGRHLTNKGFANVPPLLGEVVRVTADGARSSLAVAQGFIRNQGDAWAWTLNHLERAIDDLGARAANTPNDGTAQEQADSIADYQAIASIIGKRLGEMHLILALPSDNPDFAPVRASERDVQSWLARTTLLVDEALEALDHQQSWAQDRDRQRAAALLRQKSALTAAIRELARHGVGSVMTRIHGDFHLGQVLVASGDAYLIDFEGEPSRPLAERRAKASPLRDVAGLLRSFDYAAAALINRKTMGATMVSEAQRDELLERFREDASTAFLGAYWQTIGSTVEDAETALLDLFLIEKAAYEILYEAANRPAWISVPLTGMATLATRILDSSKVASDE
jgi:maltose alpha-D-glucosyltransferase / alpha-amylase